MVGASHAGATRLSIPLSFDRYENWLAQGHQADMKYLEEHAKYKESPTTWQPLAQSAFVFAFPYVPHPEPAATFQEARTALYSQGRDYHHWLKEKLSRVVDLLKIDFPEHDFFIHTDSSPILERDLAYRAGLGWFGKNTCLIHPKHGSLFLIGEILSSLQVDSQIAPVHDFCGTCTRCLDICPTKALVEPRVLKSDRCISYLTIESRNLPDENLRPAMGDWLFGCDLCQTVCPWNQKAFKTAGLKVDTLLPLTEAQRRNLSEELREILTASHNQTQKRLKGTALSRAGAKGLKRNALVVIGNQKLKELRSEVEKLTQDEFLGELATWSIGEIDRI